MCSSIVLSFFMIGVIAGAGLCIVGLATPGWFGFVDPTSHQVNWKGIFDCFQTTDNSCKKVWDQSSDYLKTTIALTIIGILAAAVALIWSCIVCFMCCCKSCLGPPLPILATIAFACQLAACVVYGVKVQTVVINKDTFTDPVQSLGWSFILIIVGTIVYFVDIILGGLVVMFGSF